MSSTPETSHGIVWQSNSYTCVEFVIEKELVEKFPMLKGLANTHAAHASSSNETLAQGSATNETQAEDAVPAKGL